MKTKARASPGWSGELASGACGAHCRAAIPALNWCDCRAARVATSKSICCWSLVLLLFIQPGATLLAVPDSCSPVAQVLWLVACTAVAAHVLLRAVAGQKPWQPWQLLLNAALLCALLPWHLLLRQAALSRVAAWPAVQQRLHDSKVCCPLLTGRWQLPCPS